MIFIEHDPSKTIPTAYSLRLTGDFFPVPHLFINLSGNDSEQAVGTISEVVNQRIKLQANAFIDYNKMVLFKKLSGSGNIEQTLEAEREVHYNRFVKYGSLKTFSLLDNQQALNIEIDSLISCNTARAMPNYVCFVGHGSDKSFNHGGIFKVDRVAKCVIINSSDTRIEKYKPFEDFAIYLFDLAMLKIIDAEIERLKNPVNNSGIDFKGLSAFLKLKGLTDITPTLLQTIYKQKQLPTGTERIKWLGSQGDAEAFRLQMWPNDNRKVFNKCFACGKNGLEPDPRRKESLLIERFASFF